MGRAAFNARKGGVQDIYIMQMGNEMDPMCFIEQVCFH